MLESFSDFQIKEKSLKYYITEITAGHKIQSTQRQRADLRVGLRVSVFSVAVKESDVSRGVVEDLFRAEETLDFYFGVFH